MQSRETGPLVVLLHAFDADIAHYNSLIGTIKDTLHTTRVLAPELRLGRFSTAKLNDIAEGVLDEIDAYWQTLSEEDRQSLRILFVGHSIGALLARKVYVVACGENREAPLENNFKTKTTRAWAGSVERIILLAGVNRGWNLNPHMAFPMYMKYRIGMLGGSIMSLFGRTPVIFGTRRGSVFITQLRLQSLAMYKEAAGKGIGKPLIIQLLGSRDELVSPEDNVDIITGNDFIYLDVPYSTHHSVIDMTGEEGSRRKEIVEKALHYNFEELEKIQVVPVEADENKKAFRDECVTDVIFVIHGIRDTGFWTQKVARKVQRIGKEAGRKYATETSTYGYFAMLPFLFSPFRQKKVEWLMDRIVENKALYPNAAFSFIGHSNGTYLLGNALRNYPACTFKNVVLAGSVLSRNYEWQRLIDEKRIESLYNFIASSDWVVGIFPKTLQLLRPLELGSGGFDGFRHLSAALQFSYISGGHGAAVEEPVWDEIADAVVHGAKYHPSITTVKRPLKYKIIGALAPFLFLFGIAFLIAVGWLVWNLSGTIYWQVIWLALYLFIVWKFLTWF